MVHCRMLSCRCFCVFTFHLQDWPSLLTVLAPAASGRCGEVAEVSHGWACWEPHTLIEMSIFLRYEDYEEDQPTVHGECCTWLVPVTALWHVSVTAPCTGAARGGTAPCLSTLVVVFEQPLLLGCGC